MSRGPGRWQQVLLEALEASEEVCVLWKACEYLGREPTRTEYSAVNRAAHTLAQQGQARTAYVRSKGADGRLSYCLWLLRPDIEPDRTRLPVGRAAYVDESGMPRSAPQAEREESRQKYEALLRRLRCSPRGPRKPSPTRFAKRVTADGSENRK
jgi:hypothetical protein